MDEITKILVLLPVFEFKLKFELKVFHFHFIGCAIHIQIISCNKFKHRKQFLQYREVSAEWLSKSINKPGKTNSVFDILVEI